jgi:hypothetical protein
MRRCRQPNHSSQTFAAGADVRWIEIVAVFGIVTALVLCAAFATYLWG